MRLDVLRDWGWADGYLPEVKRLLALNAMSIFKFEVASFQDDVKRATDMLVSVSGTKAIAVRIRSDGYWQRDLTLRAQRSSGITTELEKIKAGNGDYYLYGWAKGFAVPEWMLVDLAMLRGSGLLNRQWKSIPNKDGITRFIAIPHTVLRDFGCLVSFEVSGKRKAA